MIFDRSRTHELLLYRTLLFERGLLLSALFELIRSVVHARSVFVHRFRAFPSQVFQNVQHATGDFRAFLQAHFRVLIAFFTRQIRRGLVRASLLQVLMRSE